MVHNKLKRFMDLIQGELCVDIPLFYNNQPNAVRLDLIDTDDAEARKTVRSVLRYLFGKHPFWLCAYGSDSGEVFFENQLLRRPAEITIVPYRSRVDRDWFEYDCDTIALAEITLEAIDLEHYLDYVFRLEFLSNTLFLVDIERKIAAHVYDRRGMDIATRDSCLLAEFRTQFKAYLASN